VTLHVPSPRASFTTTNPSLAPSPRFVGTPEPEMPASLSHRIPHILTPSGRAFSVGGRVQDISSDPLAPCILFWPDNEPRPEQGQIRPSSLVGVPVRLASLRAYACLTRTIHSTLLSLIQAIEVRLNINPVIGYARNATISTGADGRSVRRAILVSKSCRP
jgi:hypothetical protein